MAQKRKAREAFGSQSLSAFAAARQAKQQPKTEDISRDEKDVAAALAVPCNGFEDGLGHGELCGEELIRVLATPRPNIQLSTFRPTKKTFRPIENGAEMVMRLDETATFVGEFELEVMNGVVSIYGAMLHANSGKNRVYALSSHALPAITAKKTDTRVRITSLRLGVCCLAKLSPLFRNLGNAESEPSSFTLLPGSEDDPLRRSLSPLEVDEDTRKVLSKLNARLDANEAPPRIMAVGAKSSGKSTFNRLLCNMMVTRPGGGRCLYLDLDPGQPEFGPCGQLSLVEVTSPLLGPPFTHLAGPHLRRFRLIRSHTIAATSFKDDPEHYISCAMDLLSHGSHEREPIVVNTCGWISGLGASSLLELATRMDITDSVMLNPVDGSLQHSLGLRTVRHQISPRQARFVSTRSPAELRAMQTMAYFHCVYEPSTDQPEWAGEPIKNLRPWSVDYSDENSGVVALASYTQAPHSDFLAESIDGMVVALVVPGRDLINSTAVERTFREGLPFIMEKRIGCSPPLHPRQSQCIGMSIVRQIDAESRRIHLVTPISEDQIYQLSNAPLVLVRGSLDCPDWAYLEDIHAAETLEPPAKDVITWDDEERPWVSRKEPVGIESSVWRLRHPPTKSAAG